MPPNASSPTPCEGTPSRIPRPVRRSLLSSDPAPSSPSPASPRSTGPTVLLSPPAADACSGPNKIPASLRLQSTPTPPLAMDATPRKSMSSISFTNSPALTMSTPPTTPVESHKSDKKDKEKSSFLKRSLSSASALRKKAQSPLSSPSKKDKKVLDDSPTKESDKRKSAALSGSRPTSPAGSTGSSGSRNSGLADRLKATLHRRRSQIGSVEHVNDYEPILPAPILRRRTLSHSVSDAAKSFRRSLLLPYAVDSSASPSKKQLDGYDDLSSRAKRSSSPSPARRRAVSFTPRSPYAQTFRGLGPDHEMQLVRRPSSPNKLKKRRPSLSGVWGSEGVDGRSRSMGDFLNTGEARRRMSIGGTETEENDEERYRVGRLPTTDDYFQRVLSRATSPSPQQSLPIGSPPIGTLERRMSKSSGGVERNVSRGVSPALMDRQPSRESLTRPTPGRVVSELAKRYEGLSLFTASPQPSFGKSETSSEISHVGHSPVESIDSKVFASTPSSSAWSPKSAWDPVTVIEVEDRLEDEDVDSESSRKQRWSKSRDVLERMMAQGLAERKSPSTATVVSLDDSSSVVGIDDSNNATSSHAPAISSPLALPPQMQESGFIIVDNEPEHGADHSGVVKDDDVTSLSVDQDREHHFKAETDAVEAITPEYPEESGGKEDTCVSDDVMTEDQDAGHYREAGPVEVDPIEAIRAESPKNVGAEGDITNTHDTQTQADPAPSASDDVDEKDGRVTSGTGEVASDHDEGEAKERTSTPSTPSRSLDQSMSGLPLKVDEPEMSSRADETRNKSSDSTAEPLLSNNQEDVGQDPIIPTQVAETVSDDASLTFRRRINTHRVSRRRHYHQQNRRWLSIIHDAWMSWYGVNDSSNPNHSRNEDYDEKVSMTSMVSVGALVIGVIMAAAGPDTVGQTIITSTAIAADALKDLAGA